MLWLAFPVPAGSALAMALVRSQAGLGSPDYVLLQAVAARTEGPRVYREISDDRPSRTSADLASISEPSPVALQSSETVFRFASVRPPRVGTEVDESV